MAQRFKCLPAMLETWVQSLGQEDPLDKEYSCNYFAVGETNTTVNTQKPGNPAKVSMSVTGLNDPNIFSLV